MSSEGFATDGEALSDSKCFEPQLPAADEIMPASRATKRSFVQQLATTRQHVSEARKRAVTNFEASGTQNPLTILDWKNFTKDRLPTSPVEKPRKIYSPAEADVLAQKLSRHELSPVTIGLTGYNGAKNSRARHKEAYLTTGKRNGITQLNIEGRDDPFNPPGVSFSKTFATAGAIGVAKAAIALSVPNDQLLGLIQSGLFNPHAIVVHTHPRSASDKEMSGVQNSDTLRETEFPPQKILMSGTPTQHEATAKSVPPPDDEDAPANYASRLTDKKGDYKQLVVQAGR